MLSIISCECGHELKIPAQRTKSVQCPKCGATVDPQAAALPKRAPKFPAPQSGRTEGASPRSRPPSRTAESREATRGKSKEDNAQRKQAKDAKAKTSKPESPRKKQREIKRVSEEGHKEKREKSTGSREKTADSNPHRLMWLGVGIGGMTALGIATAATLVYFLFLRPPASPRPNREVAESHLPAPHDSVASGTEPAAADEGSRVDPSMPDISTTTPEESDRVEPSEDDELSEDDLTPRDTPRSTLDELEHLTREKPTGSEEPHNEEKPSNEDPSTSETDEPPTATGEPTNEGDAPTTEPVDPLFLMATDVAALHRGVAALLAIMKDPENEKRLVFPLHKRSKVTGYKDVAVRYTRKIVTEPVWKYIYKPVEVLVPRKVGSVTIMKKEIRQKVFKKIKIGEKQVARLFHDKNGDVVRQERHAIYGEGGPDLEHVGWFGNNAMALYTLLDAGVTPAQEPALSELANTLESYVDVHGIPDFTWDISWGVAAFTRYPGDQYAFLDKKLTGRLVSGQCTASKRRGLWGPLCVSAPHLAKVLEEFSQVEVHAEKVEAFAKQKGAKNDPRLEQQRQAVERAREEVARLFHGISRTAHRFVDVRKSRVIEDEFVVFGPGVKVAGWPYSLYQETMGDLQSTALAVFALRVAHENDKLPEKLEYEHLKSLRGGPLVRPIAPADILETTLDTLVGSQGKDGKWDELIVWAPTREFARLPDRFKGPPVTPPANIEPRTTPICNPLAVATIDDLCAILGALGEAKLSAEHAVARKNIGTNLEAALDVPEPKKDVGRSVEYYRSFDPVAGGMLEPYAYLHALRLDPATFASDPARLDMYAKTVDHLTTHQADDGLWTLPKQHFHFVTPSLREVIRRRVRQQVATWKRQGIHKNYQNEKYVLIHNYLHYYWWTMTGDEMKRLSTLYALLTLNRACGPIVELTPSKS